MKPADGERLVYQQSATTGALGGDLSALPDQLERGRLGFEAEERQAARRGCAKHKIPREQFRSSPRYRFSKGLLQKPQASGPGYLDELLRRSHGG
jgi:hypothetical protein